MSNAMRWARARLFLFGIQVAQERLAETIERIEALVLPVLTREGLELVDLEYKRAPKRFMLRLLVDRAGRTRYQGSARDPEPPGEGVTIDDCVRVSKLVGPLLDVEDVIPTAYTLEVSSPGVNRPLKTPAHFKAAVGLMVRLKTRVPVHQADSFFIAPLTEADDERVVLDVRGTPVEVPYRLVASASIEYQF
ncbi:MAG: ribosome maturation factor RimP [Deltaproteobacteria bacterium]|nr:MAG: ribosome maturation factor RimP [Deltaproteobacteria bacterium]